MRRQGSASSPVSKQGSSTDCAAFELVERTLNATASGGKPVVPGLRYFLDQLRGRQVGEALNPDTFGTGAAKVEQRPARTRRPGESCEQFQSPASTEEVKKRGKARAAGS